MPGLPYPVLDETDARQRNAVLDFVAKGRASGNMYPVGNAICAWYAGWMAAALAALGETTEPAKRVVFPRLRDCPSLQEELSGSSRERLRRRSPRC